ncbi:MAG: hypothetical protein OEU25_05270, partial [Rhodospirillales bacterium]|nr:hypothetical protein [Rhodospirillales bacterium]
LAVYRLARHLGAKFGAMIDRVPDDVDQSPENRRSNRNLDWPAHIPDGYPTSKPGRLLHRYAADRAGIKVLLNLYDQAMRTIPLNFESVVDLRQRASRKCDVHYRTADRGHASEPAAAGVSVVIAIGMPNGGLHHRSVRHQVSEVGMHHRMQRRATKDHNTTLTLEISSSLDDNLEK